MIVKPYDGDDNYIFLSYSHRDNDAVHEFVGRLQEEGYNVWFDEGIDPGTEWDENIADHIENCAYFIAYITQNYIESQNCRDEINFARDLDKDRLLIYGEDVELPKGMKMRMNRLQAIYRHKYSRPEDFYAKVFRAHGIDTCKTKVPEPPVVPGVSAVAGGDAAAGVQNGQSAVPGGAAIAAAGAIPAVGGEALPVQPAKKKLNVKVILGLAALAVIVVACLFIFRDTTPHDLESLMKQNPELMESLKTDDPNAEVQVKGNDIYYYYTFDDYDIDVDQDNSDVLFEAVFHASDEDMAQNVRDLEEATGFSRIRLVFVGYYNNKILFQRIWTRDGVA